MNDGEDLKVGDIVGWKPRSHNYYIMGRVYAFSATALPLAQTHMCGGAAPLYDKDWKKAWWMDT